MAHLQKSGYPSSVSGSNWINFYFYYVTVLLYTKTRIAVSLLFPEKINIPVMLCPYLGWKAVMLLVVSHLLDTTDVRGFLNVSSTRANGYHRWQNFLN